MTYPAERAELALLATIEETRTPEMYALAQEFLRTRKITWPDGSSTADPRAVANAMLRFKRFPQSGTPSEGDLTCALEAYLKAPAPTMDELEERYQRLMERVKAPNRLHDLHREGPSEPEGYQRLASTLTRVLKRAPEGHITEPYSEDEIHMIARVFEQFTNMRVNGNPWQTANVGHTRNLSDVWRTPNDTDLSYAERCYYEAKNRLARVYMGTGIRRHIEGEREYRIKAAYTAERAIFEMNPNYTDSEIIQLSKEMFAPHKVTSADAGSRINTLADAMCLYRDAFNQLQQALYHSLPASKVADEQLAMLTAGSTYRRRLSSMMNMLETAGFSHAAACSALFTFSARLAVADDLAQEFEDALQKAQNLQRQEKATKEDGSKAATTNSEPPASLPQEVVCDWLADVAQLKPYLASRVLFHPGLELRPDPYTPYPSVSAETIAHLKQVGYAPAQPAHSID